MVKFKSRYILVETLYNDDKIKHIEPGILAQILKKNVELLFGDIGLGQISKNLQVKYVNNVTNLMILRISRDYVNLLWTILALMNELDGEKIRMHVIGVSGTIKKCEIKAKLFLERWTMNFEKLNKEI